MRLAIEFLAPLCYKKEVTHVLGGKKKEEIVSDQGNEGKNKTEVIRREVGENFSPSERATVLPAELAPPKPTMDKRFWPKRTGRADRGHAAHGSALY